MNRLDNLFMLTMMGALFTLCSCSKPAYNMNKNSENRLTANSDQDGLSDMLDFQNCCERFKGCLSSKDIENMNLVSKRNEATAALLKEYFSSKNPYELYSNESGENATILKERIDFVKKYNIAHISYKGPGEHLQALSNNLQGYDLAFFKMTLEGKRLEDDEIQALANMKQLTYLDILGQGISIVGVKALANNLKNLTYLVIACNDIGDAEAEVIANNMPQLIHLDIAGCGIGNNGMKHLYTMTQLMHLNVRGNEIDDNGMKDLPNMKQLSYLDISWNPTGDALAKTLEQLTGRLRGLDMSYDQIGNQVIQALSKLKERNGMELGIDNCNPNKQAQIHSRIEQRIANKKRKRMSASNKRFVRPYLTNADL